MPRVAPTSLVCRFQHFLLSVSPPGSATVGLGGVGGGAVDVVGFGGTFDVGAFGLGGIIGAEDLVEKPAVAAGVGVVVFSVSRCFEAGVSTLTNSSVFSFPPSFPTPKNACTHQYLKSIQSNTH